MAEEDNVFRRWIRLKQAAKERLNAEPVPTDGEEAATPVAVDAAEDRPSFDLSSLPSIDSIAADTDIATFLRAGVPAELTRLALRRAWTSDPAIRDFIGIAENQWDFNDPNALPGFGPLDPAESANELLAQLGKGLEQLPDALADIPTPVESVSPAVAVSAEPGLNRPSATDEPRLADGCPQSREIKDTATSSQEEPVEEPRNGPPKRRHGSALPR